MNDLHFGVVVGIDHYPGIEDLRYARRDAVAFHEWLTDPSGGGVPEGQAKLVTAPPDARFARPADAYPTQRQVNDAMRRFADAARSRADAEEAWARTRFYLYVAGHGYAPADGKGALLLADAARDELGYHLEMQRCVDWLVDCAPFKEVVVFSDCCRRQYQAAPLSTALPFDRCHSARSPDVFAMLGFAARRDQDALEPTVATNPDDERGVFTKALVQGLEGAAAQPDGSVTAASLAGYVRSAVEATTARAPVPQRVEFPGDLAYGIVLARPPGRPVRDVTVRFPPGATGTAEIRGSSGEAMGVGAAAGATWVVALPDGLFELRPAAGATGFGETLFKVAGEDREVHVT